MRSDEGDHLELGKDEAVRALDHLWEIFRHRGHGTIAKVERQLDLPARTLNHWRHRSQLRYADLLAVLSVLGVEPNLFFGSLFPASGEPRGMTQPIGGLGLLLQRSESLLHNDGVAALEVLAAHRDYRSDHRYCLAVGSSLKVLEMWGDARKWIGQAIKLAPNAEERAACALRLAPILALPLARPKDALALVDQVFPLLPAALRALANLYKGIIFRALGERATAARSCTVAILDAAASTHTQIASRQILGLILAESGDVEAAAGCLSEALLRCSDRRNRGHVLWAMARISEGEPAVQHYATALRSFGKYWLFESLQLTAERFSRLGYEDKMCSFLSLCCQAREGVFRAVVEDMKAAVELPWRSPPDVSQARRSWDQWKRSQLRRMRLSF